MKNRQGINSKKHVSVKSRLDSDQLSKGGQVENKFAELSNIRTNVMGTANLDLKIPGMRKAQEFTVYPIDKDSKDRKITIQSDSRIGVINLDSGNGAMSQSHSSGAYFHHLSLDKKTFFHLSPLDTQNLRMHIFTTAGSEVGESGIVSDNSGAVRIIEKGGEMRDYTKNLGLVKVIFINPDYNYYTNVSGDTTEQQARDYFVGKSFNVAAYPQEQMKKVIDIKFYPKGTYDENMGTGGKMNDGIEIKFTKSDIDKLPKEDFKIEKKPESDDFYIKYIRPIGFLKGLMSKLVDLEPISVGVWNSDTETVTLVNHKDRNIFIDWLVKNGYLMPSIADLNRYYPKDYMAKGGMTYNDKYLLMEKGREEAKRLSESDREIINENGLNLGAPLKSLDGKDIDIVIGYNKIGKELFIKTASGYELPYNQVVVDESKVFSSGGKAGLVKYKINRPLTDVETAYLETHGISIDEVTDKDNLIITLTTSSALKKKTNSEIQAIFEDALGSAKEYMATRVVTEYSSGGSMATGGMVDVRFEQIPVGFGFNFGGKNYHKEDAFTGSYHDGTEKKFQFSTIVNVPSTVTWLKKSSGGSMEAGGYAAGGMISKDRAREIANNWHGGQNSALYQFASSGTYLPESHLLYLREVQSDMEPEYYANPGVLSKKNERELNSLKKFFEFNGKENGIGTRWEKHPQYGYMVPFITEETKVKMRPLRMAMEAGGKMVKMGDGTKIPLAMLNKISKEEFGVSSYYTLDRTDHNNATYVIKQARKKMGTKGHEFAEGGNISDYYIQDRDFFIDKETFKVTTREDVKAYQAKSIEDAKRWIDSRYEPLKENGSSMEVGGKTEKDDSRSISFHDSKTGYGKINATNVGDAIEEVADATWKIMGRTRYSSGGTIRKAKVKIPEKPYFKYVTVERELPQTIITNDGKSFPKDDIIKEFTVDSRIIMEYGGKAGEKFTDWYRYGTDSQEKFFDLIREKYEKPDIRYARKLFAKLSPEQKKEFIKYGEKKGGNDATAAAVMGQRMQHGGTISIPELKEISQKAFLTPEYGFQVVERAVNDPGSLTKKEVLSLGFYLNKLDKYASETNNLNLLKFIADLTVSLYEDDNFKKGGRL